MPGSLVRMAQLPKILARFGDRGAAMLLCAYIWTFLGFAALEELPVSRPGVFWLDIPHDVRAGAWWVSAAVALVTCRIRPYLRHVGARRRPRHWPARIPFPARPSGYQLRDWSSVGLAVLLYVPGFVVVSYGLSLVFWVIPGGIEGYRGAYYLAALYGSCLGIVGLASRFPSPPARIIQAAPVAVK